MQQNSESLERLGDVRGDAMKRMARWAAFALIPFLVAGCENPFGLDAEDVPFITVEYPVYGLETGPELVAYYAVSNPGTRRFYLRVECRIGIDRLGPGGWEDVWSPEPCPIGSETQIVLEPGSDMGGLFAASQPGGWAVGTYRLRFTELEVADTGEGANGRVSLPMEWRVSEPFEVETR